MGHVLNYVMNNVILLEIHSQVLEQVAQRGCVVHILRDYQDLTGKSPEEAGLTTLLTLL